MILQHPVKPSRIPSIDIFRGITMFLMIFVNDLWTLKNVPHWLEHAGTHEDMLGFSDLVFPSFLFILGMSIPLAIENRLWKGESKINVLKHILIRSVALLIMGLFTVNTEYGVAASIGISRPVFIFCMLFGFFLVWNVYPATQQKRKKYVYQGLKIIGLCILLLLAWIYKDPAGNGFQSRWWGILGLIGWTYLVCATIYLFARQSFWVLLAFLTGFCLLCIAGANHWLGGFSGIIPGNGCFHGFTMSGVMLTLLFNRLRMNISNSQKMGWAVIAGTLFLVAGLAAHSYWIISKNLATPTWMFLCTGISIGFYVFIYWLVELKGKAGWFAIIGPAGTATLTCYLIPYLLYAIFDLFPVSLPDGLITAPPSLLKSVAFSFICIGITALLGKAGIKLKI